MYSLAEIGQKITFARKNRQLTQTELANRAGVSRPTIDLLENGRASEIGYSKLARILASVGLELRLQAIAQERPTLDDLLKDDSGDD
jgi:transcriptional regulator with XRE-family HTH domain